MLLELKLNFCVDFLAHIKNNYYLCAVKRLFRSLINNYNINQSNVKIMKNGTRPDRGIASVGVKRTGNPSGRTQYRGGGRRGC